MPDDRAAGTPRLGRRILWLVPLVHLLVWGLYSAMRRPVGDFAVETDFFGDYVPWSRAWMQGHLSVMSGFKGPVYYLLLGIPSRILSWIAAGGRYPPGLEFAVGKALSVAASALAIYLVGWIALRLSSGLTGGGGKAALTGGASQAAFPAVAYALLAQVAVASNVDFIDHSYRAATDLPALALILASIAAALSAGSTRGFLAAGALAALAYLTRYNAVAVLPAVLLIGYGGTASDPPRRSWRNTAAVGAAFALVCLPWWLLCWARAGNPLYNRNALNAAFEVFGRGIPLDTFMAAGLPFDSWADLFQVDARLVLRTWEGNIPRNLHYDAARLLGWPIAALCLVGWALALSGIGSPETRARRKAWAVLALAWLCLFLSNIPIFYGSRFSLPGLPFYALGLAGFAPWIDRAIRGRRSLVTVVLALAGAGLAAGVARGLVLASREDRFYQPREVLEMRRDLRRRGITLNPNALVASRKPHGAYWLGLRPAPVPEGDTIERIVDQLRLEGVGYLYVGSSTMVQRPVLEPLANPGRFGEEFPGLHRLAAGFHRMGNRVIPGVLYEVVGAKLPPPEQAAAARSLAPSGVPRAAYARYALGRLYLTQFLVADAEPLLVSAATAAPRWAPALEAAGDVALFTRSMRDAVARYVTANQLTPDSASAWARLAACSLAEDRVDEARRNLAKAIEHLPPALSAAGYARIGEHYFTAGEYGAAVAPLFFACLENPSDEDSRLRLARIPWVGFYPILGAP